MEQQFYKCYSWKLKEFLKINEKSYLNKGFNDRTQRVFYIYEMDDELSRLLTLWSKQYK